jgi:Poly(ADP-ribose) polymerase catalytic domain
LTWSLSRYLPASLSSQLIVPQGPYKEQVKPTGNKAANVYNSYGNLHNNEYIVYDPAQVRMRYLLVVQNKRYCPVCTKQKGNESLKRIQDFNFNEKNYKHNVKRCNEYESMLICMQMVHQGTDAQEIYQEGIENQLSALETNHCGKLLGTGLAKVNVIVPSRKMLNIHTCF